MLGGEMALEIVETASLTMEDWWGARQVQGSGVALWLSKQEGSVTEIHMTHTNQSSMSIQGIDTRRKTDWWPESMQVSEKVRKYLAKGHFGGMNKILNYETHCPDTVSVLCNQGTAPTPKQLWEIDSGSYWTSTSELKLEVSSFWYIC